MAKHASYVAVIQRVADGEERRYPCEFTWDTDSDWSVDGGSGNDWSWWSEGNYGCDCNRYLCFERAGGHNPPLDDPLSDCSYGKYRVLRFEFPDGTSIPGPDADG